MCRCSLHSRRATFSHAWHECSVISEFWALAVITLYKYFNADGILETFSKESPAAWFDLRRDSLAPGTLLPPNSLLKCNEGKDNRVSIRPQTSGRSDDDIDDGSDHDAGNVGSKGDEGWEEKSHEEDHDVGNKDQLCAEAEMRPCGDLKPASM